MSGAFKVKFFKFLFNYSKKCLFLQTILVVCENFTLHSQHLKIYEKADISSPRRK